MTTKQPFQLTLPLEMERWREKIETSVRPYIKVFPQQQPPATFWESKFGGRPYLPKDVAYPLNPEGEPLFFLAQINFEETPALEPFPSKGILQFYVESDGLYGWNEEEPDVQERFRVLYFEEILKDESHLLTEFSWLPEFEAGPLPKGEGFSLQFELLKAAVPLCDHRIVEYLGASFFAQFGDRQWALMDAYSKMVHSSGHKLGGYAFFTQQDPRYEWGDMALLFQLDSDSTIGCQWGDMGVGNFFISQEDLTKRDFSKVLYHWDCY
jgi:uncharacterized protein YwqG